MTPRIRQDLKATAAEEQGIKYFDVADPRSGSKMRLYDFEWLIAEQLNGSRRFDEVADYARDRLGLHPSASDIEAYASKLAELGFIEHGNPPLERIDDEPETTPLPVPVPAPPPTLQSAPIELTPEPEEEVTQERETVGTAKTMMAVAAPPIPTLPPAEKPAPPAVTTVEKKTPAPVPVAAPAPSQSSAMAAAAPSTTGKVTPIGDAEPPKKSGAGSMILVLLVILGVGGAVAYMKYFKPETTHVTVALASPREVVRLYDGSGVVKKGDSLALSFGEAGKVTDVVAKGTEVKPGMPLATLESYGAIEKQLADVKDRLKYYEGKLDASKAKNDEAGVKTDEAKVAEKKKLMGDLEARAAKVRLVAPGTGTVTEVLVAAGGEAKAGEPAVKMGGKGMSAEFKAEGPKPGEAVQVQTAAGGAPIAGKVTVAANGSVTVELPDDAPLKAGDQLRLVKKKEANVIPVPTAALTQRDGTDVVFVLSDGEVHSRKVTVSDKTPTEVFISSGLANGESVITSDATSLQEGQKASSQ
jgi:hypothetical protein